MNVDVILGLQWGDEGKGKVVDVLTPLILGMTKIGITTPIILQSRLPGSPHTRNTKEGDIGRAMLTAIRSIAITVSKYSGCCVLSVDAKPDAELFYERFGFHRALKTKKKSTIPMYRCNIFRG